ncbi:MAG: glycerol-3-phosphate dehydrogenase [Lentisphaerae bacterium GWF2_45_14]|nr:MAG: glycerol-3-phosphate dehydrogenase [Lentisphaerae bacterium GWF2_45_14]
MLKEKICVLSDGGWGTAIALLLCGNGHDVVLWGPFPEYIEEMKAKKENSRFLAGVPLDEKLVLSTDIADAVSGAKYIYLASPSQYARSTLEKLRPFYKPEQLIISVAKGIENGTLKRMSEVCSEVLGRVQFCVLSGPSHAEEVARKCPTAVVAASSSPAEARAVQELMMNSYFRVYTTDDVTSVELGGSLKNVLAIAAGVVDGMKMGDNSKAALITRGIAEMSRLGDALGGREKTFAGLSGTGDLIVTCMSGHSRNRHVGEELGRGRSIDEILKEMGLVVAEGVKTSKSAYELARKCNVITPIIDEVYKTLYENKDPRQAVYDLMTRRARSEFD